MSYVNRVFDNSVSRFVPWVTSRPDPTGNAYPGPGAFGIDTEGFTAQALPGERSPVVVVGSAAEGDTLADCTYVDTGNGAELQRALNEADDTNIGEVVLRSVLYVDLAAPGAPLRVFVPNGVAVRGGGRQAKLRIQFRTTGDVDQLRVAGAIDGALLYAPPPTDAMTVADFPFYVLSTGELHEVSMNGGGEFYTPTEAAWQPAQALMYLTGIKDSGVGVWSVPRRGELLADWNQAMCGIVIGGAL